VTTFRLAIFAFSALLVSCSSQEESTRSSGRGFTVAALGDGGERNSELKSIGSLITRMHSGEHDGGRADMILFLGDNFYPTGLNVPSDEVEDKVSSVLRYFEDPVTALGRGRVHAVAGNHDYYTRHAFEASALFGLINIEMGPIGLSDRGNERARSLEQWTYHYDMPAEATVPVDEGGQDQVSFIFFDSARLLRTDPPRWKPGLDSLERLLKASAGRGDIRWRVLAVHHPFYSVGEHGGYTEWDDVAGDFEFLTPCDKDSNALSWFKNFLDPEDLCAERYRGYVDSMRAVIGRSGANVDLVLAGHDHSLQLLSYPERDTDCSSCPKVHIVTGSASKVSGVRKPHPPEEYTAFDSREGLSVSGFAQVTFFRDEIRVRFFQGKKGEPIDMGDGKTVFRIDGNRNLIAE